MFFVNKRTILSASLVLFFRIKVARFRWLNILQIFNVLKGIIKTLKSKLSVIMKYHEISC